MNGRPGPSLSAAPMDRLTASALAVSALLLIVGVGATGRPDAWSPTAASARPAPDPTPAPDFELATRSGEPFRLSDHRGRVVLLNLWATWCSPCRHEIPDFMALQDELGAEGFTVVGVALDEGGWDVVGPFVDELGVSYPVAVDDGTVERLYGPTRTFPTSFLIDRRGDVRHRLPGMVLRPDLEPLVRELLAEPAPPRRDASPSRLAGEGTP